MRVRGQVVPDLRFSDLANEYSGNRNSGSERDASSTERRRGSERSIVTRGHVNHRHRDRFRVAVIQPCLTVTCIFNGGLPTKASPDDR